MKTDTSKSEPFHDHFVDELRDLYYAEHQLLVALPKMAKAASASELSIAFEDHLKQTKGHVDRLEQIFCSLNEKPTGKKCKAMAGLIKEADELLLEDLEEEVLDAALIGAAQKVEHYEMAGYGTARTWATRLGDKATAQLLQETLEEEAAADKKLTSIAEKKVNRTAVAA